MLSIKDKREKLLFYSITSLGVSSVITQLILVREFLSVFYGNEIVIGVILANWLLLTGIGAYLGKYSDRIRHKLRLIIISQILIAILPFFYLIAIRSMKNTLFPVGSIVGIQGIFLSSFILLLPYAIISGFMLTLFCSVFSKKKSSASIGKVYFIDNIGDILGGFIFSFIMVYLLNHLQMIFIIMVLNLCAGLLLSIFIKNRTFCFVICILIVLSFSLIIFDFNRLSTGFQYRNQDLIYQKNSLYGNIVVTESGEQLNFFENGILLFSTDDTISNEETVHYAIAQHDRPNHVLLISGGVSGTLSQILKYNVENIDYVELDPEIIDIGKKFTSNLNNDKINIIIGDARLFVKQAKKRYDVVIIDLPDPSTAQINRFYTIDFFNELKNILSDDAVVSTSLISTENYISEESRQLQSVLYKTMKMVFDNVIIIPGNKNYFIASDSALSYDIQKKINEKNITTEYVKQDYLKGILTKDRIGYVNDSLIDDVPVNSDFRPVSSYYQILFWMSNFRDNYRSYAISLLLISILIIIYISRLNSITFSIFTTGFTASSLEMVLLVGFQVIYGYVYHKLGIMITMFMLGLAVGSFCMNKKLKKTSIKSFIFIELLLVLSSFLVPLMLFLLSRVKNNMLMQFTNQLIFPLSMFLIAILVGMEFPLAAKLRYKGVSGTSASLYNADLVGACLGALSASSLLIPFFGVFNTCFVIAAVNVISVIIVSVKRKNI